MDCVQKLYYVTVSLIGHLSPSYHYLLYISIKVLSFIFCDPLWFVNLALQHDLNSWTTSAWTLPSIVESQA